MVSRLASVPAYFALRVTSAILLLKLSASLLTIGDFAVFAQLILFASILNLAAVGGTQHGLIRQSAAALDDPDALARTQTAALTIWAVAAPLLFLPILLTSTGISTILVGVPDQWPVVIAIAVLALAAGPGQIWCSILSGRRRVPSSLLAQATGLITGTLFAAILIARQQPVAAAVGFASGPLATMIVAARFAGRLRIRPVAPRTAATDVRALIRFSAAFAATSSYVAILLFGLRFAYRDAFGATALGYWMAANRVSDMSMQLLGLFMIQFFVSHVATMTDARQRRAFIVRCWAAGAAVMTLAILIFSIAPKPLVQLFLSEAFVPAIPIIRTYMVGDLMRVWATLAMFAAFAQGRPGRYAAIEIGTLTVMAVIVMTLISAGDPRAPQIGYATAYAVTAVLVTATFLWRLREFGWTASPWQRHGGHRTPRPGSEEHRVEHPPGPPGPLPAIPPPA